MATIALDPLYPIPRSKVAINFSLTESGTNYVRAWVTDAPAGSAYRLGLDKARASRALVFESDSKALSWDSGNFDLGGAYVLAVQEYNRGASSYGGRFEDDPNAAPTETKVGSEYTLTVYIGQRVTSQAGAGADRAKLVLWVWNNTIRQTTLAIHGEVSPAIIKPATNRAASATADATVKTNLAALVDVTASTALGSPASMISNIITRYEAHRASAVFHSAADSDNTISAGYKEAPSPSTLPLILTEILKKLSRHETNDRGGAGNVAGVNSGAYHASSKVDWTNYPIFTGCASLADVYPVLGEIYRCYEAHRVSAIHGSSDTTALTAAPPLVAVHQAFMAALAALSPTIPATKNGAAVLLASQAGFVEES